MTRLALIAVTLAALAAPATAGTTFNLSALSCQTGYAEGQTTYADDGRLYNTSTTWWRTAMCPIFRPAGPLVYVRVTAQVVDLSFDKDVQCRLITTTTAGVTTWGPTVGSSGTSSTPQALKIPEPPQLLADGTAFLHCYLPQVYAGALSGLASYAVQTGTL
jgi:hypothetical protein